MWLQIIDLYMDFSMKWTIQWLGYPHLCLHPRNPFCFFSVTSTSHWWKPHHFRHGWNHWNHLLTAFSAHSALCKSQFPRLKKSAKSQIVDSPWITGWWFRTFFIFPRIGSNYPNWLIFFRRVGIPPTRNCRFTMDQQMGWKSHAIYGVSSPA